MKSIRTRDLQVGRLKEQPLRQRDRQQIWVV